jgi:hypothetical protein
MAGSGIIPLIALILSCGVLINGCATHSRLPSEAEEKLIQQHREVIVLLRHRGALRAITIRPYHGMKSGREPQAARLPRDLKRQIIALSRGHQTRLQHQAGGGFFRFRSQAPVWNVVLSPRSAASSPGPTKFFPPPSEA